MRSVFVLQVKNVKGDSLAGKVGKIYMPKQEVRLAKQDGIAFHVDTDRTPECSVLMVQGMAFLMRWV